ncbi:MAG: M42 family metallopeptidase [Fimbriimonas ginsengisoli]|uniref:M42 family metallopeptidase n=1 Tax=Fimbriimonas ginsengisoli TaxID=1005039 RepID=A0A931LTY0_FIMGI|nr:M42 family metallopeptidase [Fimbriimonas ginsengisoli]
MNLDLLRRLTEAHGVSGQEDAIRDIVRAELKGLCEMRTDSMGNLHCVKKGKGAKPTKLMLAAHMDEIGFVVKHIDDKGFLRLQTLGGWDPRSMASQRVFVHAKGGVLNGVMMPGVKPKHMLSPEELGKGLKIEDFFVDVGLSAEEATKAIRLGDMVSMNRTLQEMGPLLTCKSMDDRVAVYVMIEALKAAKSNEVEVHAIATVQEEVGLRGAAASGSGIAPDICVAIDITLANDIPAIPEQDHVTRLGEGAAIKIMDSSLICHPKVVEHFRSLAERHKIKHQMEILGMGGTDAGGVQRLHGGIPSFTLSIPTRYVHTVNETVHRDDVDACVALLARYIEDAHRGSYGYE